MIYDLPYAPFTFLKSDKISQSFGVSDTRFEELKPLFQTLNKKMVADFFREIKSNVRIDEQLDEALTEGETGGVIPVSGNIPFDCSKYLQLAYSSNLIKNNRELLFVTYMIARDIERFSSTQSQEIMRAYVSETCDKILEKHGKEANVGIF
jgi:hypothetical protein